MNQPVRPSLDHQLEQLRQLTRIRLAEDRVMQLRRDEAIIGSVHLCNGQEAIPVGAAQARREEDPVFATYRGHGWALATGVDMTAFFSELLGRSTGPNGGRGGSAYFSDRSSGFYGENSVVGAGAPIACGAALGFQLRAERRVAIVVFGEGAMNQGAVNEAFNFAGARRLPVVFICENNGYSELTPTDSMVANSKLFERAQAFGFDGVRIDGNDVDIVAETVEQSLKRARNGEGPTLIEAMTQRLVGHYIGDAQIYRPPDELAKAAADEPIIRLVTRLQSEGVSEDRIAFVHAAARDEVETAVAAALAAPPADISRAREHVYG